MLEVNNFDVTECENITFFPLPPGVIDPTIEVKKIIKKNFFQ